ncbi:hypothetical protein RR48_15031 [Papilio machaon]|uniref:Uncharacterized protein n=1 Tax=Papilio machaon TaxID=76193 RepID=A0A194R111_PAPMA|nr:hypothetical protein RR48_15031 [Papilio machaon]
MDAGCGVSGQGGARLMRSSLSKQNRHAAAAPMRRAATAADALRLCLARLDVTRRPENKLAPHSSEITTPCNGTDKLVKYNHDTPTTINRN